MDSEFKEFLDDDAKYARDVAQISGMLLVTFGRIKRLTRRAEYKRVYDFHLSACRRVSGWIEHGRIRPELKTELARELWELESLL